ncbi:hypothetical protein B7494_g2397 [Chlorociboria aeruginascens]|nr:hypothetical protein B7494_g2397 [Chlorociboria aeruginascens]
MASSNFMSLLSLALALASLTSAHFIVTTPSPLGNNIDNEDVAPCGGFTPSGSEAVTDFHVGGDAIGVSTLHAQASFAYRGVLGLSLSAPNWTVLLPTLQEYGLNNFCEPSIEVPALWAGEAGLLQVIQDAEDGVHYQCMAVNFVAGIGTPTSVCSNSSGVSASFMADPVLASAEGLTTTSPTSATESSTSSPAASGTSAPQASHSSKSATTRLSIVTRDVVLMVFLVSLFAI